jgi:alpha-L-fucosidase
MIFLYYSIGIDWSHPFFMPRSMYPSGRPDYAIQPPEYRWKSPEDSVFYRNYMMTQITELCTWYGNIDGFWFDPIGGVYAHPELFRVDDIYALIRKLQPQALIGYKTGYDGTEDFVCSEREPQSLGAMVRSMNGVEAGKLADAAWDRNKSKPLEICDTFQDYGWSYVKTSKHRDAHWLWKKMGYAAALNANFLVNTGPVADGSIYPADEMALREIGRRLKKEGWPKPDIDGGGPKATGPKTAG